MTTLERAERDQTTVEPFLTVADAAKMLQVSCATVRLHAAEIGGIRIGRQWRFTLDGLRSPKPPNGRGPHPTKGRLR